ncbi:hypothetical protein [uncultured Ilyobacter sp.]|uniref:hypothetical protein n=1 Tax=uncultured Ilyobacter sp. TaxID=544433 RepID=UPI0029C6FD64|nr:hypothetical protein [uncultured Ilyobacter sp.]
MNVNKSKELAELLSREEVFEESIEGIFLQSDEVDEILQPYLLDQEEYLAYLNPISRDRIVVHILAENEEVLVSFLMLEDGSVEEIYGGIPNEVE